MLEVSLSKGRQVFPFCIFVFLTAACHLELSLEIGENFGDFFFALACATRKSLFIVAFSAPQRKLVLVLCKKVGAVLENFRVFRVHKINDS